MSSTSYDPTVISGLTTSWLPFITPWTAPTECSSLFFAYSGADSAALIAFDPAYDRHLNTNIACNPPEVMSYLGQNTSGKIHTSLGPFTCPGDWFSAASSVISETKTVTYCCPSGYDVHVANGYGEFAPACLSTFTTDVLTYAYSSNESLFTTTSSRSPSDGASIAAIPSSNFSYTVTAFSSVKGYNIAMASSASMTGPASNERHGLSTGAKAGLGVGVGVGVIALVTLLLFFYVAGQGIQDTSEEPQSTKTQSARSVESSEIDGIGISSPREMQTRSDAPE